MAILPRLFGTLASYLRIGPNHVEGTRLVNEGDGGMGVYRETSGGPIVYTNLRGAAPVSFDDYTRKMDLDAVAAATVFPLIWGADSATVEFGAAVDMRIFYPGSGAGLAPQSGTAFPQIVIPEPFEVEITEFIASFTLNTPVGLPPGDDVKLFLHDVNASTNHFLIDASGLAAGAHVIPNAALEPPLVLQPGDLLQCFVQSFAATAPQEFLFLSFTARARFLV